MSVTKFIIRKNQYFDSVFLMGINKSILSESGVIQSAVLMGTPNNKKLLTDIQVVSPEIDQAGANDLIVAVIAETEDSAASALGKLDEFLERVPSPSKQTEYKTIEDGFRVKPNANLAVISVPGEFAAREAFKALDHGLNVFLFSSNVSVEDELKMKRIARDKGLLVMGPDCGTSILCGTGIGFANKVRRGPVGVVGPSGTGLQEMTCLVHHSGSGISHAIGTGSRDLKDEIGGLTTFMALDLLEKDASTNVVAIISKPVGDGTLNLLLSRLKDYTKPVVTCFMGETQQLNSPNKALHFTTTIDEAAEKVIGLLGLAYHSERNVLDGQRIDSERLSYSPQQKFVRGLFAGGTFCYQSQAILLGQGFELHSNEPLKGVMTLSDPDNAVGNSLIDMGDEHYTQGKPHPMLDGTMRSIRILHEADDSGMAVLLLDFILGFNASADPVGEALQNILAAQKKAEMNGRHLTVIASLTGTEEDPQDFNLQRKLLEDAKVIVTDSNAQAVRLCAALLKSGRR
jgi:FdrA protein